MSQQDYAVWLSDEDYQKAVGQMRLQFNGILSSVFTMYGYQHEVPGVIGELIEVAEQFGKRVRGRDVPIVPKKLRIRGKVKCPSE